MENEKKESTDDKITKIQSWENFIKGEIMSLSGLVLFVAVFWDFLSVKFEIPVIPIPGIEEIYVKYTQMVAELVLSVVLFRAPNDFLKKCLSLFDGFKK